MRFGLIRIRIINIMCVEKCVLGLSGLNLLAKDYWTRLYYRRLGAVKLHEAYGAF